MFQLNQETAEGFDFILRQYFADGDWEVHRQEGGVNNTTRFIHHRSQIYILRIYENHRCEERLRFEHAVLAALQAAGTSFRVPNPVASLAGGTWVHSAEGKLAALFAHIEGERPDPERPEHVQALGRAQAELLGALAALDLAEAPSYEPYYAVYEVHPAVNRDTLLRFLGSVPDDAEAAAMLPVLREEWLRFERELEPVKTLPMQLIHGDLVFTNSLVIGDRVSAVLDFEFVTADLRAMELAVTMADLFEEAEPSKLLHRLEHFLRGFGEQARLSGPEIEAIPLLIRTRTMNVFVHFYGRYLDGIDSFDTVVKYMRDTLSAAAWLNANGPALLDICQNYLAEEAQSGK